MRGGGHWQRTIRIEIELLLAGLGSQPATVAAALRRAGLALPATANPIEQFLAAVVGADPAIAAVHVTHDRVTVLPATHRHRRVVVELPEPVRRFIAGLAPGAGTMTAWPPTPAPQPTTPVREPPPAAPDKQERHPRPNQDRGSASQP
jgi:hypothetical protein